MIWQENPFYILQVPMTATKSVINDKTDDLSFDHPEQEDTYENARNLLSNPQKRIAAEICWFPGMSKTEDDKMRAALSAHQALKGPFANDLIRMNSLIYNLTCEADDKMVVILAEIDRLYQNMSLEDVQMLINETRQQAKITVIQNIDMLRTDWREIRNDVRSAVQSVVKEMRRERYTRFANELAKRTFGRKDFGVIIEDFFSTYQLDMNAFIMEKKENIKHILSQIPANPGEAKIKELEANIRPVASILRPLALMQEAKGINEDVGELEIYRSVNDVAVDFFKENKAKVSLSLLQILQRSFSYVPLMKKQLENDIAIVEAKVDENQSTAVFEEADQALSEILDEEKKKLYFEDGHSVAIMNFYRHEFCGCYQKGVEEFLNRQGYRSDEYMFVCYVAALIYKDMASSLTWADRFDLAADLAKRALQYAKKSGDQELIDNLLKDLQNDQRSLDMLEENKRQRTSSPSPRTSSSTSKESDNDSGGCLLIIGLTALGACVGGPFGAFVGFLIGSYFSGND